MYFEIYVSTVLTIIMLKSLFECICNYEPVSEMSEEAKNMFI